jgi:hypothetical protein
MDPLLSKWISVDKAHSRFGFLLGTAVVPGMLAMSATKMRKRTPTQVLAAEVRWSLTNHMFDGQGDDFFWIQVDNSGRDESKG